MEKLASCQPLSCHVSSLLGYQKAEGVHERQFLLANLMPGRLTAVAAQGFPPGLTYGQSPRRSGKPRAPEGTHLAAQPVPQPSMQDAGERDSGVQVGFPAGVAALPAASASLASASLPFCVPPPQDGKGFMLSCATEGRQD